MAEANLKLSEEELALASNASVMLLKNAVIEKVNLLFGQLSLSQPQLLKPLQRELEAALEVPAKISRGESYRSLPYLVLDYPRYFRPHDVMAIRTMFWWGNFFSVTLHLKGNYREHFSERILKRRQLIGEKGFHACIAPEEWEHHFGEDNYLPVDIIEEDEWLELYRVRLFTKLSKQIPIGPLEKVEEQLVRVYAEIAEILS
jgi:hypothetical protein